jgi:cyclic pyranopterin phosphate synthase
MTGPPALVDRHGRVIRELRVSVTNRCNFRCLYCRPAAEPSATAVNPAGGALTLTEIERVVRVACRLGVCKVRLTGGEPLLRAGLEDLVARLARMPGLNDLALTTNGCLFLEYGPALRAAGLRRVSFSLDSLDPASFRRITGQDGLDRVLAGVALAQDLGLAPLKVNAVIVHGVNDHEIEALADFARNHQVAVRFVEFMPLGASRHRPESLLVPGREIRRRLHRRFALWRITSHDPAETATRWRFADGAGEIGIIAPVTEPFCAHCNRLRLTAEGKLQTCLFSARQHDLTPQLREGASDDLLAERLKDVVQEKEASHQLGAPAFVPPLHAMSCIGG